MIRIVGVQRSEIPQQEFILLQNQGNLRINLRGHVILSDSAIDCAGIGNASHVFSDEELIPAGMYVLLTTGTGTPRWARTKDGQLVYYAYMGRDQSVWTNCIGPFHVLSTHHTYAERRAAVAV